MYLQVLIFQVILVLISYWMLYKWVKRPIRGRCCGDFGCKWHHQCKMINSHVPNAKHFSLILYKGMKWWCNAVQFLLCWRMFRCSFINSTVLMTFVTITNSVENRDWLLSIAHNRACGHLGRNWMLQLHFSIITLWMPMMSPLQDGPPRILGSANGGK